MLRYFIRKQSAPHISHDVLMAALARVNDPVTRSDIVTAGLVTRAEIKPEGAVVVLAIAPETHAARVGLIDACRVRIKKNLGLDAQVVMTAHREAPPTAEAPKKRANWNMTPLPHVTRIIAVASGKGGVGKSTTTVNLAHALTARGLRVGILDADIYGPSIPRMLGLNDAGQPAMESGLMQPHTAHGIRAMSMGLIMGDTAAVMRAPMVTKALSQMLRGVAWGAENAPLDVLLIDMPPGTGDVHISLAQSVPLSGAIIVTTPQDVAVIDAKKCATAFEKMGVPLLGVIENMSGFTDPSGKVHRIFGEGGGARLASEHHCAFLGDIALEPAIGAAMEAGSAYSEPYSTITEKLTSSW